MADDTGTLVLEPAATEESAPVEELDTVETSAETEPTEETQETEPQAFTEEDIKAAREEAAKEAREAALREAEEARNQQQYQAQRTQAAQIRQRTGIQKAMGMANWIADQVESGKTREEVMRAFNAGVATDLVGTLESMVMTEQWENLWGFYRAQFDQSWRPSQQLVNELKTAEASMDSGKMLSAAFKWMREYVKDTEAPKLAQELLKSEREKNSKASEVARVQEGDKARASSDRPTQVSGGGVVSSTMTSAQIEAMSTNEWMSLPKERRDYLLAHQDEANARARRR